MNEYMATDVYTFGCISNGATEREQNTCWNNYVIKELFNYCLK